VHKFLLPTFFRKWHFPRWILLLLLALQHRMSSGCDGYT